MHDSLMSTHVTLCERHAVALGERPCYVDMLHENEFVRTTWIDALGLFCGDGLDSRTSAPGYPCGRCALFERLLFQHSSALSSTIGASASVLAHRPVGAAASRWCGRTQPGTGVRWRAAQRPGRDAVSHRRPLPAAPHQRPPPGLAGEQNPLSQELHSSNIGFPLEFGSSDSWR